MNLVFFFHKLLWQGESSINRILNVHFKKLVKIKCIMMYKKKLTWFPYTPSMDEEIDKQTNIIGDENVK